MKWRKESDLNARDADASHRFPAGPDRPLLHPSKVGQARAWPPSLIRAPPGRRWRFVLPCAVGCARLGAASVAARLLAEDGTFEVHALARTLCFQGSAGTPVRFVFQKWSVWRDSNSRLHAPKACRLTAGFTPKWLRDAELNRVFTAYETVGVPAAPTRETWLPESGSNGRAFG